MRNPLTVVSENFLQNIFREVEDEPWETNFSQVTEEGTEKNEEGTDHHTKKTILNASRFSIEFH